MARIIKTNGVEQEIKPKNGKDFKLKELQSFVGGYIEIVDLDNGEIMVVNEEGLLERLPFNSKATKIAKEAYPGSDMYIVGDVLVCKDEEVK